MPIYEVDPLTDPRWDKLLGTHSRASVFHTVAWLRALRRTYGYEPVAYTTSAPGQELRNSIVFCRVSSWVTGRRLVSLPFSDHCDLLVNETGDLHELLSMLERLSAQDSWRYIELRPLRPLNGAAVIFSQTETYCYHQLDLSPDLDTIFSNLHKDSIQRKIRRAEREGLGYEEGHSDSLLDIFCRLQLLTRRRHQLPPQPRMWFRNLIDCFGDKLKIRVAFKHRQPIASILTLCHKDTLVYKYGCSDSRFNNLGGTHLLFWRSIEDAKKSGMHIFDLGRSDDNNVGLITFKDRWAATRSTLTYVRYPSDFSQPLGTDWKLRIAKRLFAHAPERLLSAAGNLWYKHIA